MKHNNHFNIAVLAVAALVPLAANYFLARVTTSELAGDLRPWIQENRDRFDARRRGYEDALNQCQSLQTACPDFNDVGSYIDFARQYGYDGTEPSRQGAQTDQETQRITARMRAFVRRGHCPGFLRGSLAVACQQLLEANAVAPTVGEFGGFLNQRAADAQKNFVQRTLRDRINQMRNTIERQPDIERSTVQP